MAAWKNLDPRLQTVVPLLFVTMVVGALAWPDLSEWWTKRQEVKKAEADRLSIGMLASTTATSLLNASASCRLIGFPEIDTCALYDGALPQEQTSRVAANDAVERRQNYRSSCAKVYPEGDYCARLLERAIFVADNERKVKR